MTITLCRPENAVSAVKLGYPTYSVMPESYRGAVINWGMSLIRLNDSRPQDVKYCNNPSTIAVSVDKCLFLKTLHFNSLNAPDLIEAGDMAQPGYILRPNSHAEGSDFKLLTQAEDVNEGYHATKLISPANEYRVWFFGNDKFLTAKRVPIASQNQRSNDVCKSKFGYSFDHPNYEKCIDLVKKALAVVRLDFGAFDMLWATDERKWYILEVNTAPSLDHSEVKNFFKPLFKAWSQANDVAVTPPQRRPVNRQAEAPVIEMAGNSDIIRVRKQGGQWIEIDLSQLMSSAL